MLHKDLRIDMKKDLVQFITEKYTTLTDSEKMLAMAEALFNTFKETVE